MEAGPATSPVGRLTVLGIDAGGTKTICQLSDAAGTVLNEARGPGAGLHVMADAAVARTLGDVITRTLRTSDQSPAALCIGMAGVDRPGEPERVSSIVRGIVPEARVLVVSDALIALEAGAPEAAGVVLIAGTGSMAFGRDADGRAARAGGWGYVLSDEGSGYWMGREALRAVMRAADRRGPDTALTPLVLAHWSADRPHDLVEKVYGGDPKPATVAALASLVERAADGGDAVAREIISRGAWELATAAVSVHGRLGLTQAPTVLAGNLFRAMPSLRTSVAAHLEARLPGSEVRPLTTEPVVGAVRLALALAEDRLRLPAYAGTRASAGTDPAS